VQQPHASSPGSPMNAAPPDTTAASASAGQKPSALPHPARRRRRKNPDRGFGAGNAVGFQFGRGALGENTAREVRRSEIAAQRFTYNPMSHRFPQSHAFSVNHARLQRGRTVENVIRVVRSSRACKESSSSSMIARATLVGSLQKITGVHAQGGIFHHGAEQGKGAALPPASKKPRQNVLIQDADLEYDPGEYENPHLADPRGQGRRRLSLPLRRAGAQPRPLLTGIPWATNSSPCSRTGHEPTSPTWRRVTKCSGARSNPEDQDRGTASASEPEITARVSAMDVRIYEVPSATTAAPTPRKEINWRDGFSALRCIFRYNFQR